MRGETSNRLKVLDLGCGNGRLIKALETSGRHFDYLGIDFSEELIKAATRNAPGREFKLADMREVDFAPASFDMIFLIASFHHLEYKSERIRLLNNINKWLKPGGYLFMTNWNLWQPKYRQYWWKNWWRKISFNDFYIPWQSYSGKGEKLWRYYHSFTVNELVGILKKAGFKVEPNGVYKSKWNTVVFVTKN